MTTVAAVGELGLIQRLARRLPRSARTLVGIGDDAAVLGWTHPRLLFASDMLVEGVHFRRRALAPAWIGWKALARNVSDIAAMGGAPEAAVVSIGLPPATPVEFVDGIYRGLARCAGRFGMAIVGGDTVRAPVVMIDVAILGYAARPVLRSGARVGDRVFVTGRLGGSLASGRHARFLPRVDQAQWLAKHVRPHAMIDLSDGLASDLWQLARASGVTFEVRERAIPVHRSATVRQALMEGEDFELLFATAPQRAGRIPASIRGVRVTEIGVVKRRGAGVRLVRADGAVVPLVHEGFQHFSATRRKAGRGARRSSG